MTDNEIIKALECCTRGRMIGGKIPCTDCPYDKFNAEYNIACSPRLMKDAFDLINRQKAEIERLQKHNTKMARKHYCDGIKEFAERLKETDGKNNHTFDDCASILVSDEYRKGRHEKTREIWDAIDHITKEMVGDNK